MTRGYVMISCFKDLVLVFLGITMITVKFSKDLKLDCNSILCGSVISSCESSFNWPMALHLLRCKERSPEIGGGTWKNCFAGVEVETKDGFKSQQSWISW